MYYLNWNIQSYTSVTPRYPLGLKTASLCGSGQAPGLTLCPTKSHALGEHSVSTEVRSAGALTIQPRGLKVKPS